MPKVVDQLLYAVRRLRRSPAFTFTAVATLALGIGVNVAIFSAVYGLLVASLPFRDADRLVSILESVPRAVAPMEASYPDFQDWQRQQTSFQALAAYSTINPSTVSLRLPEGAVQLNRVLASGNFFSVLGVTPISGRAFDEAEDTPGHNNVAILSLAAWQKYFGRDPKIIGQPINLNGSAFTVVGILPAHGEFPADGDVWLPLSLLDQPTQTSRVWHSVRVLGRLRAGVSLDQANTELQTIAGRLAEANPATNRGIGVRLEGLRHQLVGTLRPALLCVAASALLVLLIACSNVAGLLAVRASTMRRDALIRAALGARPVNLMIESTMLSTSICLLGGLFGLALAGVSVPFIRLVLSHATTLDPAMIQMIRISWPLLALSFAVCAITAIIFGLSPFAWNRPSGSLQGGLGSRTNSRPGGRLRDSLVAFEIMVALVVLFLCVIVVHSFERLSTVDPGYRVDHLLTFEVTLPQPRFQDGSPETIRFYRQLLSELGNAPGIISVAATTQLPLSPSEAMTRFLIDGQAPVRPGAFPAAQIRFVSPDFFTTMGLHIEQGRAFTDDEVRNGAPLFVVNQAFRKSYLGQRDPIGAKILLGVLSPKPTSIPVIGVVSNAHETGLDQEPPPEIFLPGFGVHEVIVTRTASDPDGFLPVVKNVFQQIDAGQPFYHAKPLQEVVTDSLSLQRATSGSLGIFAVLALILAVVGIYGTLAYSVAQRTQEFGVRIAMGAQKKDITWLVLRKALAIAVAGAIPGLIAAFACGRFLRSMLFETGTADPVSVAITIAGLLAVVVAASCIPARRAAQVEPIEALRAE